MSTVSTSFEGTKYTIRFNESNGELEILRHLEKWENNPQYSKMLIHILYEVNHLRSLLKDISYDFDPDKQIGPPCGPEMLKRIQKYEERFQIDLRFIRNFS